MPWIEGLRPRGLHFDPASSRMFVGTPEGALAVGLKLDPEPQLENDPQVAMLPLPATMPLGSISSGPGGSGLTLFSPERRAMLLYDSDLELRSIVGRTVRFPRRFTPLAAAPSPTDVREFLFVGAGETTLLGAFLETEPLAAGPAWARYR